MLLRRSVRSRPSVFAYAAPLSSALEQVTPRHRRFSATHMQYRPDHHEPVPQPTVTPTTASPARVRNADLRVRQHVNPLAAHFQRPLSLPDGWFSAHFAQPALPLTIDVGVARGRWAAAMAAQHAGARNFLGLEIRAGLVAAANAVRDRDGLRNLHYMYANANVSYADITRGAPPGVVELVCFQFCDPWFKARHAKRRMVQEPLIEQVADTLHASRGRCYVASDVLELAVEMRNLFSACPRFERDDNAVWSDDGWLVENPFGVLTEREVTVLASPDGRVYRALFRMVR